MFLVEQTTKDQQDKIQAGPSVSGVQIKAAEVP